MPVSRPEAAPDAVPAGPTGHTPGRASFDTALGRCTLAWNERGLTSVRLPDEGGVPSVAPAEPPDAALPGAAPPFVHDAVRRIQALLAGTPEPLADLPLDVSGLEPFERRVYEATQALAPGETCSYGELARRIGDPAAARAVGHALGRNPWPLVVPCHRVLAAGGRLGGFSAPGGAATKQRLLVIEAGMRRREGELF
jgi:methylated-DNA-[protein]-cysteine S-methyltransferase